jgi:hypothetical protein
MATRARWAPVIGCALAVAACGGGRDRDAASHAHVSPAAAVRPAALSTDPRPCATVAARTLRAIGARIEARAAVHRGGAARRPPTLVARLTGAPIRACAPSAAQTVADAVGAVGERLVHAEAHGPEVARALRLAARDPAFVGAVRTRDAAALRAAIVRFFEVKRLHIVRVRAVTESGQLVGDVGGPFVLAPASRRIRVHGRTVGRVTLSIQDDAGYIKLMRRFTGAGVVLRSARGVVPGSAPAPAVVPERGIVEDGGRRVAVFAFTTAAFPSGPLRVALLVPLTRAQATAIATSPPSNATPAAAKAA